ncbi:MAG TPA: NADP-dependent malic enzyme [Tetragenococcus sp.]|nr:NADP-dependent malic enzyme [Tetragenococcus sp.]
MTDVKKAALEQSQKFGGKLAITPKVPVNNKEDLAIAYTPGVAAVSQAIAANKADVYQYTTKKNTVAVVSDGSAVLGLGNIGAAAALPVMEGKAILFKRFGAIDAIPICLASQDTEEIIASVKMIAPTFGGINLEDIAAPRCFEIESRLKAELDIPVFHDDQHGTSIVVLAALYNALKLADIPLKKARVVINGGGSAGIAIAKKLLLAGIKDLLLVDKKGIIAADDPALDPRHQPIAQVTNAGHLHGSLQEALKNADVFIGVSAPDVLQKEWIKTMNDRPIIFAMANPTPEIMPAEALAGGAFIVGTGRSDFANQINNVLAFPGIFRGALDAQATDITDEMQLAAAFGIAHVIAEKDLRTDYIIPDAFDPAVAKVVAQSVRDAVK